MRCEPEDARRPFAAIDELVASLAADPSVLSPYQAAVLDAVTGRADPALADVHACGAAIVALLGASSAAQPVTVVVDGAEHVDPASDEVLGFAGRRLRDDPVLLVRLSDGPAGPEWPSRLRWADAMVERTASTGDRRSYVRAAFERHRAHRALGGPLDHGAELLAAAEALGPEDADLAAVVFADAAIAAVTALLGDVALAYAHRAVELAAGSPVLARTTRSVRDAALVVLGRVTDVETSGDDVLEVLADEDVTSDVIALLPQVALTLIWREDYTSARAVLDAVVRYGRARGLPTVLPDALLIGAVLRFGSGEWVDSLAAASEAAELAEAIGARRVELAARSHLALLHALRGDGDRCRHEAEVVLRSTEPRPGRQAIESATVALAEAALAAGDPDRAVSLLEPLLVGRHQRNPAPTLWEGVLIDAYLDLGRHHEACALLDDFSALVTLARHERGISMALRCRGRLVEPSLVDETFARAAVAVADPPIPFARARLDLHWGERLIADGREEDARERLLAALRGFERVSAVPWADRALRALRSTDARTPSVRLTDRELLAAREAARGLPVERIAAEHFLSPQTVRTVLASAIAKLGGRPVDVADDPTVDVVEGACLRVEVLRGFRVMSGVQDVTPPPGQPSTVVQFLAVRGSGVHAEEMIELFWPMSDPVRGRIRLRNVLARLRRTVPGLVVRRGDLLVFGPSVEVDLAEFDDAAVRALATRDVALARRAVADLGVELLPGVRYEDWASGPRARSLARALGLLSLLADSVDPDEAAVHRAHADALTASQD